MNSNKLCSLKGCNYKAEIKVDLNQREIRLCPKHKNLVYLPLMNWSRIK